MTAQQNLPKLKCREKKEWKKCPLPRNRIKHPWTLEHYLKVLHVCNVNTRNRMKKDYSLINVWSNDQAFSKMNRYQQQTQEVQRISIRINIKKNRYLLILTQIEEDKRHIILKKYLLEDKDRNCSNFSSDIMQILYPVKLFFKSSEG